MRLDGCRSTPGGYRGSGCDLQARSHLRQHTAASCPTNLRGVFVPAATLVGTNLRGMFVTALTLDAANLRGVLVPAATLVGLNLRSRSGSSEVSSCELRVMRIRGGELKGRDLSRIAEGPAPGGALAALPERPEKPRILIILALDRSPKTLAGTLVFANALAPRIVRQSGTCSPKDAAQRVSGPDTQRE